MQHSQVAVWGHVATVGVDARSAPGSTVEQAGKAADLDGQPFWKLTHDLHVD
jgi:hypothetical protein